MKQIPNNNKATMNNKVTAKQTKKQRKAEADAHRRTNKRWERVETSNRYRKAATEELCNVTTNVQDRILRRIIEKRQAQANHKKHGRSEDFTSMHITLACTSKCMKDIRKKRYAA